MLNVREAYEPSIYKIIPYGDADYCAGVFAGENIIANNIEFQECGSNALSIGGMSITGSVPTNLQCSSITNLLIDGNGGIETQSPTDTLIMRTGIVFKYYYKINIQGVVNDFRFKARASRQNLAFRFLTKQVIPNYILRGDIVRIKNNTGGADFTPLQGQLTPTTNDIGTVFQISYLFDQVASDTGYQYGSAGNLEVPNQYLALDLMVLNQYDQANGGTGYDLTNNDATNKITINNTTI